MLNNQVQTILCCIKVIYYKHYSNLTGSLWYLIPYSRNILRASIFEDFEDFLLTSKVYHKKISFKAKFAQTWKFQPLKFSDYTVWYTVQLLLHTQDTYISSVAPRSFSRVECQNLLWKTRDITCQIYTRLEEPWHAHAIARVNCSINHTNIHQYIRCYTLLLCVVYYCRYCNNSEQAANKACSVCVQLQPIWHNL